MINLKTRAVILKNDNIFLVKDSRNNKFMLPGWTYEEWETIKESFKREVKEELWIEPIWDKIVSVREFEWYKWKKYIEFLFLVENVSDFEKINKSICTHWCEWTECWFYKIDEIKNLDVLPLELWEYLEKIRNNEFNFYFE